MFLDKNGNSMVALHWEKYMQHAREKYNKELDKNRFVTQKHAQITHESLIYKALRRYEVSNYK